MKSLVIVMLTVFAMVVVTSMSHNANADVIRACYKSNTGELRIVTGTKPECLPSEKPITLNPPAPKPIGYTKYNNVEVTLEPNESLDILVYCDTGDYVTGCSYSHHAYTYALENIHVFAVLPVMCVAGDICHGCKVRLKNVSSVTEKIWFAPYAFCADVNP